MTHTRKPTVPPRYFARLFSAGRHVLQRVESLGPWAILASFVSPVASEIMRVCYAVDGVGGEVAYQYLPNISNPSFSPNCSYHFTPVTCSGSFPIESIRTLCAGNQTEAIASMESTLTNDTLMLDIYRCFGYLCENTHPDAGLDYSVGLIMIVSVLGVGGVACAGYFGFKAARQPVSQFFKAAFEKFSHSMFALSGDIENQQELEPIYKRF